MNMYSSYNQLFIIFIHLNKIPYFLLYIFYYNIYLLFHDCMHVLYMPMNMLSQTYGAL